MRVVLVGTVLLLSLAGNSRGGVLLDETKVRVDFRPGGTVVLVPFTNDGPAVAGTLRLAWLDPDDLETGTAARDVRILSGATTVEIGCGLTKPSVWMRLRYRLDPELGSAKLMGRMQGTLALERLSDQVFVLKAELAPKARAGRRLTAYARAVHPVTGKVVEDVALEGTLSANGEKIKPVSVTRLAAGTRALEFELPAEAGAAHIFLQARRGEFLQEAALQVEEEVDKTTARIQTDKPIYQPGQTLHMRAVVLDGFGRAAAGMKVMLRVNNGGHEEMFSRELTASLFGVVQADYVLPETAGTGVYRIEISTMSSDGAGLGVRTVAVRRYELPSFTVTAKGDRPFFLPGQPIAVTVRGMYLFGKPVGKGRVRIVRHDESEKEVAEGAADAEGVFRAVLGVTEIGAAEAEGRFADTKFDAYYTDPGSGRTEQRRFSVRQSREALHVYLRWPIVSTAEPAAAYVLSYTADGEPAAAEVTVRHGQQSITVRTNRLGAGKVLLRYEQGEKVLLSARDASGQTGHGEMIPWADSRAPSRVETERTMYRTGEAVRVRLTGMDGSEPVIVHALAGERVVASREVLPVQGRGEAVFPYVRAFRRKVVFAASGLGAKAVVFPDGEDLQMSAITGRVTYRPGEKAEVALRVADEGGRPVAAALGVAIVDPAVAERVRTDREFGRRRWFGCVSCKESDPEIGGVRLEDLFGVREISPALDLLAEAMLAGEEGKWDTGVGESQGGRPKFSSIRRELGNVEDFIRKHYAATLEFPREDEAFRRASGIWRGEPMDPWETPYKLQFGLDGADYTITFRSAGPDRQHGTKDDFTAWTIRKSYYLPAGRMVAAALRAAEDYPANEAELSDVLRRGGLAWEGMRDPWGNRYLAKIQDVLAQRTVHIASAGPDGKPGNGDDVPLGTYHGTYFSRESARIETAILAAGVPPRTVGEYTQTLQRAGIDVSAYRDLWGRPYRMMVQERRLIRSRANSRTVAEFGKPARTETKQVLGADIYSLFSLRSAGPDGKEETYDDFDVLRFSTIVTSESDGNSEAAGETPLSRTGTGQISGVVTDVTGGVIVNATVTLLNLERQSYRTRCGYDGSFHFTRVPPGRYSIRVESGGFQIYDLLGVRLRAGQRLAVTVELQVGSVTEVVSVEASPLEVQTSSASAGMAQAASSVGTPRVREYFPETLLWLPEVLTDGAGTARLTVPLADTVTTWKVAVFASTQDGRMAETEGEVRAFVPFFLDVDPPAVLTEGDRVEVPVTVRNYSDAAETVRISLAAENGAGPAGSGERSVTVRAGESGQTAFPVTAGHGPAKGKLTLTGKGSKHADAVRKTVEVRPDGQRRQRTVNEVLAGNTVLAAAVPETAIPGATRGELRLYPNFTEVLLEGAAGVLEAPHGCAEQTASGGYSNLIAWRYAKAMGVRNADVEAKALGHVRKAVEGVAGYTGSDGGVRYWGKGEADLALTAYALQFLTDAAGFVPVDRELMRRMAEWLADQQGTDGAWAGGGGEDRVRSITALAVRALAAARKGGVHLEEGSLASGIYWLGLAAGANAYSLAHLLQAQLETGNEKDARETAARLAAMGRQEGDGVYWEPQGSTPFHGWGPAGRFEATGAVVSALAAWRIGHPGDRAASEAMRSGVMYLLRHRDDLGGWRSTQGTVRAMRALADSAGALPAAPEKGRVSVLVNGRTVRTLALEGSDPVRLDVSAYLTAGENEVTVKGGAGALARLHVEHWVRWEMADAAPEGTLRLKAEFERTESALGEPVRCVVEAERSGAHRSGMLLAEIALPPGSEADRASLEKLAVDRYEVLPDRVVFYFWPQLGGAKFEFIVRSRMRVAGKTGVSALYDYYNPDAAAEVWPVRWEVH